MASFRFIHLFCLSCSVGLAYMYFPVTVAHLINGALLIDLHTVHARRRDVCMAKGDGRERFSRHLVTHLLLFPVFIPCSGKFLGKVGDGSSAGFWSRLIFENSNNCSVLSLCFYYYGLLCTVFLIQWVIQVRALFFSFAHRDCHVADRFIIILYTALEGVGVCLCACVRVCMGDWGVERLVGGPTCKWSGEETRNFINMRCGLTRNRSALVIHELLPRRFAVRAPLPCACFRNAATCRRAFAGVHEYALSLLACSWSQPCCPSRRDLKHASVHNLPSPARFECRCTVRLDFTVPDEVHGFWFHVAGRRVIQDDIDSAAHLECSVELCNEMRCNVMWCLMG